MKDTRKHRQVVITMIVCFVLGGMIPIVLNIVYPGDTSGEFPIYPPNHALIAQMASASLLMGLTLIAMKAEEEKETMAAAGFAAAAISFGIAAISFFEITKITSLESYVDFYNMTISSNFLLIPSFFFISTYSKFKRWIRLFGIAPSIPLLASTTMFMTQYRDFKVLENLTNTGYLLFVIWVWLWAYNIYHNYKEEIKGI
jgi:hypothetical protein